jgi:hypothetical protein
MVGKLSNASPVIIIGMHRSGTTVLSNYLDEIGMFMGKKDDRDINNESRFFIRINNWLLRHYHSEWDNVNTYINRIEGLKIDSYIKNDVKNYLLSVNSIKYWGYSFMNPTRFEGLWGWKDPRTTVTLDLWLEIFPNLKIIFMVRNPIDVAISLKKREEEFLRQKNKLGIRNRMKKYFLKGNNIYQMSPACLDLEYGVSLWEEYNRAFLMYSKKVPKDRIFTLKYEDFLLKPKETLKNINQFLEIEAKDDIISNYVSDLDSSRVFAFKDDDNLKNFYLGLRDKSSFKYWGYSDIFKQIK